MSLVVTAECREKRGKTELSLPLHTGSGSVFTPFA